MTLPVFDFRKPPLGELERQAVEWLKLTCRRSSEVWARLLPFPAQLQPGPVQSLTASAGFAALPSDSIGVPITTTESSDGTLLLALQRPLLLALVAGLLGETPLSLPADRNLTELEASLVDYLIRELFLQPLEHAWPAAETPSLTAGRPGLPRVVSPQASNDSILLMTFSASMPFGEFPVHLLVPRRGRWESLVQSPPKPIPPPIESREQIEALVREMPVDLSVVLGTADLTMLDLARLKTGDVIVLRQKINQPLDGLVSGARKFRVWPGVRGTRAAVLIDAPVSD
jgi:flagellar motor switch protein FliM